MSVLPLNLISRNSWKPWMLQRQREWWGRRRSSRFGKLHLDELLGLKVRKQESHSWKLYQPAEHFKRSRFKPSFLKNQLSLEIHSCVNRRPLLAGERCGCVPPRVIRRFLMELMGFDVILSLPTVAQYWFAPRVKAGHRVCHSPGSVPLCPWVPEWAPAPGSCWSEGVGAPVHGRVFLCYPFPLASGFTSLFPCRAALWSLSW